MDVKNLSQGFSLMSDGNVLSVSEQVALTAALEQLHENQQLQKTFFWGKVTGVENDYYVACGMKSEALKFPEKQFFVAQASMEFQPLDKNDSEEFVNAVAACSGPLSGQIDKGIVEGEEEAAEPEEGVEVPPKPTEKDRLATLVREIDHDCATVPKGAYQIANSGWVENSAFKATNVDVKALESYQHFRVPESRAAIATGARADVGVQDGVLDSLSGDQPKGSWSIRENTTRTVVSLRSNVWNGYQFVHEHESGFHGGCYIGDGSKNNDLAFQLP